MSLKDEPFAIHLRFGADIFQPGFYIKNPSISIEDSKPTSRHKFYSFNATGGEPIEPEDEKKLNVLIPILCSIIGFSLIVLAIILIIIIKRRNYKKFNDPNKIEMEKDNESEISEKQ
ncbi:hypothetical protein DDB_G0293710 [Dictyostelium discoideum AX4]|uniref:Uncharacterized protein n=1 Tax=Dictyostelium discoideum TaxID=44689 RepID=Q54BK6_DICDI|nr:hypothetical protein DDB_G0293710 [Dictyostelium discoideum AX4]EAL60667.1 hypothetical protein DDB_G0293710 [Dictyostelium discoideum AX4]|eukprot:XP_629023.1 hypothetical protein DDB_G0293710 [Dictyostelium discoideum AX4]